MERLVVGSPRISVSPRQRHSRPVGQHKTASPPPPKENSCPPQEPPHPPQEPPCSPPPKKGKPVDPLKFSPSSPLFSLFGKEIFGEDLLLLLLILLLIEENADKLLIGALIYVFLG